MPLAVDLQASGLPVGQAGQLGDSWSGTIAAAGSNLATATVLTSTINNVTSVATNQGVSLPVIANINSSIGIGRDTFIVMNNGTASLKVYPGTSSDAIAAAAAGTNVAVGTKCVASFTACSGTQWTAIIGSATA